MTRRRQSLVLPAQSRPASKGFLTGRLMALGYSCRGALEKRKLCAKKHFVHLARTPSGGESSPQIASNLGQPQRVVHANARSIGVCKPFNSWTRSDEQVVRWGMRRALLLFISMNRIILRYDAAQCLSPTSSPLDQVAEELATSRAQIYALVRWGDLAAVKIGGRRHWRVERSVLEE